MTILPQLSAIKFTGKDAGEFLHNQVSADVLALADGEITFACYCEPKGRVLALVLIGRSSEGYFIILSSELTESIARRLRIYVMRSDVNVEPLDDCVVAGLSDSELSDSAVATLPLPGEERMLVIVNQQLAVTGNHELAQEWKAGDLAREIGRAHV